MLTYLANKAINEASKNFLLQAFHHIAGVEKEIFLPTSLSFTEAINYLAKAYDVVSVSVYDPKQLALFLPVIAFHKVDHQPVLLWPKAHAYEVRKDPYRVGKLTTLSEVKAHYYGYQQIVHIPKRLMLYNAKLWLIAIMLSLISLALLGYLFYNLSLVNKYNLGAICVLSFMFLVVTVYSVNSIAIIEAKKYLQHIFLVINKLFTHIYCHYKNILYDYDDHESIIKKYFTYSFITMFLISMILLSLLLIFFMNVYMGYCYIFVLLLWLIFNILINKKVILLDHNKKLAQIKLSSTLEQMGNILASKHQGLNSMISRLYEQEKVWAKVNINLWHYQRLWWVYYVVISLNMILLLWLFLEGNIIKLDLWSSLLVVELILCSGIFIKFIVKFFLTKSNSIKSLELKLVKPPFGHMIIRDLHPDIMLNNIAFSYEDTGQLIINNFNVHISAGHLLMLCGPSSSGKTTLIKIIMGMLMPERGEIIFGGHDLRSLDKKSLRQQFGVVLQDAHIFGGSIYDNIACYRNISVKMVDNLLISHPLWSNLLNFPLGMSTYIFAHGRNLSKKERCMLLLARALVHKPRFIFIDELSYTLSQEDMQAIMSYIKELSTTAIITAHEPLDNIPYISLKK